MSRKDDKGMVRTKRYGYGAGLPVAWQGWALLAGYIVMMLGCVVLVEWDAEIGTRGACRRIVGHAPPAGVGRKRQDTRRLALALGRR